MVSRFLIAVGVFVLLKKEEKILLQHRKNCSMPPNDTLKIFIILTCFCNFLTFTLNNFRVVLSLNYDVFQRTAVWQLLS